MLGVDGDGDRRSWATQGLEISMRQTGKEEEGQKKTEGRIYPNSRA
jgi:hypothetical protein